MVEDLTVTSARTDSNVPVVGASLPLHDSLAMETKNLELDADFRISSSLRTPYIQYFHKTCPLAL
jgi:hypothetical protein